MRVWVHTPSQEPPQDVHEGQTRADRGRIVVRGHGTERGVRPELTRRLLQMGDEDRCDAHEGAVTGGAGSALVPDASPLLVVDQGTLMTLSGTLGIDGDELYPEADGETYLIHIGPEWYAEKMDSPVLHDFRVTAIT